MKLGIVANEFGDPERGRMGGFGWAARETARLFLARPELGVQPCFFSGEAIQQVGSDGTDYIHGVRLVHAPADDAAAAHVAMDAVDLLLTIDWRPGYYAHVRAMPGVPLAVWVRDPRATAEISRVAAIRAPGAAERVPDGLSAVDCTSLAAVAKSAYAEGRPLTLVSPEPSLSARVPGAYGILDARVGTLPNPIALLQGEPAKRPRPTVVFLGRLDPVKRPWLVYALAERMPQVEFLVLGKRHFKGADSCMPPAECPRNLHMLGHVDGAEKQCLLAEAWVLVNTSAHEGLAVSFLEALACETPLAAFVDTGNIVSRFGICAGPSAGSGEVELDALEGALRRLLEDQPLRAQLGRLGRTWVERAHGPAAFLAGFASLCRELAVRCRFTA